MFLLKKLVFKFMELGLGLKPCFFLETKNPIFINFKLSTAEAETIQKNLPAGFQLQRISFTEDSIPEFWLSYNLYEIKYPKKELQHIRKARCEINTFVVDPSGKQGIYVFAGSPFVSKESRFSLFGFITDLAERLVMWIYGVGQLENLEFDLDEKYLTVKLRAASHDVRFSVETNSSPMKLKLARDYIRFNDISFFNKGKTFDLVNANSQFSLAEFREINPAHLPLIPIQTSFFRRSPDQILFYPGEISYLVSAMNRNVGMVPA